MSTEKSLVAEARELLRTHSIVAMRIDKPYREIRPLISALCDEVDRQRAQFDRLCNYASHADDCEWWGRIRERRAPADSLILFLRKDQNNEPQLD